jgi:hypothetical protein
MILKNIIVGFKSDEALFFAKEYSNDLQRPFYEIVNASDLNIILQLDKITSITFIGSRKCFNHCFNSQVSYILSYSHGNYRFNSVPYSYLTARTLEELKELLKRNKKQILQPNNSYGLRATFLPIAQKEIIEQDKNHMIFTRQKSNALSLKEVCQNYSIESLAIVAHSSDDCVILGPIDNSKTIICGAAENITSKGSRPGCSFSGKCVKHNVSEILDLKGFNLSHVFLNTCKGLRLTGGPMSEDYSIGLKFLDQNIISFISSERVKDGNLHEAFLYQALLANGLNLGEVVQVLNNNLSMERFDFNSFILVGDPIISCTANGSFDFRIEEDKGKILVHLQNVNTFLINILLYSSSFYEILKTNKVEIESDNNLAKDIYYLVYPTNVKNGIKLILYSHKQIIFNELQIKIMASSKEIDFIRINSIFKNLKTLEFLQIRHSSIQNYIQELIAMINSISLQQSRFLPTLHENNKYKKSIHKFNILVDKIQNMLLLNILESVRNGPGILTEKYGEFFENESFNLSNRFCSCGNQLYIRTNRHKVIHDVKREIFLCPRCSIIYDHALNDTILISLEGNDLWHMSEINHIKMVITNDSNYEKKVYCGVSFSRQTSRLPSAFDPEIIIESIPPKTTKEISMKVDCKDMDAHVHNLKGYVLSDFEITYLHKPITIIP